jgi:hypothetical protein
VARAPVQRGGQPRHPVPRQRAALGPLGHRRRRRRSRGSWGWGRGGIRRRGGMRHGVGQGGRAGWWWVLRDFFHCFCWQFAGVSFWGNETGGLEARGSGASVPVGCGGGRRRLPSLPAALLCASVLSSFSVGFGPAGFQGVEVELTRQRKRAAERELAWRGGVWPREA